MNTEKPYALNLADALCEVRRLDAEQRLLREARARDNVSFKQLLAQRDALLEALKMARPHIATHSMDGYHAEARADAAIKAVEEGK